MNMDKIKNVFIIKSKNLGSGNSILGKILMKNFLYNLIEHKKKSITIIFINESVLFLKDKEFKCILDDLNNNEIKLYFCGTCIDYYELKKKIKIESIINMYTITKILLDKNINSVII